MPVNISPVSHLPAQPNLEHLKHQARSLLREARAANAAATARFRDAGVDVHPLDPLNLQLADALHVIAREYGFATWPALKLHVELAPGDASDNASADPREALAAAVKASDAALVRAVLERSPALQASLNEPLPGLGFDTPVLVAAAQKDNREMVDALLEAGADINVRSRWWAGGFGVLDVAGAELSRYLIDRGAVVDLHAAARLGMVDRVRALLAGEPQRVHARGADGQLPLHFAATAEIAALLLDAGAELDARDVDHESTAAQYMTAIKPYRHDVARMLLARGAQADILMASALGDRELVETILNDDPDATRVTVSERSFPKRDPRAGGSIYIFGFGWTTTPHMLAQRFGHEAIYTLLMQRSALPLRLINAAEAGDRVWFDRVLESQPQVMQKLSEATARRLIGTATRNNTQALQWLLAAGWPATAAMPSGHTALHFAAFHGNDAAVKDLLAHGADVHAVEQEHHGTPLSWAVYGAGHGWYPGTGDYPAVVRTLLAAGADAAQVTVPEDLAAEVEAVLVSARE